jgi:small subunit ribosomal protein S17
MSETKLKPTKIGIVSKVSSKNTVSVIVQTMKMHPVYKKRIKISKKYLVHCTDENMLNEGMKVRIKSCRPISKQKSWYVEKVIESN